MENETMVRGEVSFQVFSRQSVLFDLLGCAVKRTLDIILSLFGLILVSPVFLLVALIVKLDSKGPVFYVSKRVGLGGKHFAMMKFRSMVQDADARKKDLLHLNERDKVLFKISNDPRITRVGGFLRRYSLDELPQLLNVLFGDMSLVGPRPCLPTEFVQYTNKQRRRSLVRPGITGLWQVRARRSSSLATYFAMDLFYVDNWSLALDVKILFQTVSVVLAGSGS